MNFIIEWIIYYCAIMFCMCVDNIFWISASPEYKQFKKAKWFMKDNFNLIVNNDGVYYSKFHYIFNYRIKTVITHWRDIIPAVITSLILTIILK